MTTPTNTPPSTTVERLRMESWEKTTAETRAAFVSYVNASGMDATDSAKFAFHKACEDAGMAGQTHEFFTLHHNALIESQRRGIQYVCGSPIPLTRAEMDALHEDALASNSGPCLARTTIESRALFRAAVEAQSGPGDASAAWEAFEAVAAKLDPYSAPETRIWIHGDALREIGEAWPPIDPLTGLPPDGPKGPDGRYLDWPDMPVLNPLPAETRWRIEDKTMVSDGEPHGFFISVESGIRHSYSEDCNMAFRIAACLNACAGIPTDELQQHGLDAILARQRPDVRAEADGAGEVNAYTPTFDEICDRR